MSKNEVPYIAYDPETDPGMDYFFLRSEGIRMLQELAGKIWTDYNEHDPGVTILEQVCFALTDIAYRTDVDIQKILFGKDEEVNTKIAEDNCFQPAHKAFLSTKTTLNDHKIFFFDCIDNIENIWFKKSEENAHLGLYDIYVQPLSSREIDTGIKQTVYEHYVANRNLCEDVDNIIVLQPEELKLSLSVDLYEEYVTEEVLSDVYYHLDNCFSHKIKYDAFEILEQLGWSYEDIFDRPSFNKTKGFVNTADWEEYQTSFSIARIYKTIQQIKGVRTIHSLTIYRNGIKISGDQIKIKEGCFVSTLELLRNSDIIVAKNGTRVAYNPYKTKALYQQKVFEASPRYTYKEPPLFTNNNNSKELKYNSIQNTFPTLYGIGRYGLPFNESPERKRQVRQLQGFLLFFDQVLLNHLAQLKNIPDIFSVSKEHPTKTYYVQSPDQVPDISQLLRKKSEEDWNSILYNLVGDSYLVRKNKVLDHLLARFSEKFVDESYYNLKAVYGLDSEEELLHTLVSLKSSLLRAYHDLGYNKNRAVNYTKAIGEGNEYSFKKKMYLLLNIQEENLSNVTLFTDNALNAKKLKMEERKELLHKKNQSGDHDIKGDGIAWTNYYSTYDHREENLDQSHSFSFIFPESSKPEDATDMLMYYGAQKNNYFISKESEGDNFQVFFKSVENDYPMALGAYTSLEKAQELITKITEKLRVVQRESEGFHVVEHLLLRPSLEQQYTLKIHIEEKYYMESVITESYADAKQLFNTILFESIKFKIYEEQKKYTIILTDKGGIGLMKLKGIVFSSQEIAEEYIEKKMSPLFKTLLTNTTSFPEMVKIEISGENLFKGKIMPSDFYENTLSLVLPAWLPRFNQDGFRTLLKHAIVQCIPAHIKTKLIWLDKQEMEVFEEAYHKWWACRIFPDAKQSEFFDNDQWQQMGRKERNEFRKKLLLLDKNSKKVVELLK